MKRRTLLASALGLAALAAPVAGLAQDSFPSKPIRIVVAWPAGGGHDIMARLLGQELGTILGTPVVVDNVTGAGGTTGMRQLEGAAPDGHTIGLVGMHAVSQSFMNPNATPLDRLQPLAYVSDEPGALQVMADTGITTLAQYVETIRADPMALVNGNDAQGGNSFVFANAIADALDVQFMQAPYMGHAPNVTALITGEVQTATLPIPPVLEHVRAGTVNVLGIAARERHALLLEVPTFAEQGYDLVVNDFILVAAPAGLPEDIGAKLESALVAAISSPGFTEAASRNGTVLRPGDAAMAAEELKRQVETVYPLLEAGGLVAPELARS